MRTQTPHCNPTGVGALFAPLFYKPDCFSVGGLWLYNRNYFPKTTGSFLYMIFSIPDRRFPWRFFNTSIYEHKGKQKMKKTSLIFAFAYIFICQIHSLNAASISIDACAKEGVTTGAKCWNGTGGNVTMMISYATHCTSSSAGCVFIDCETDCTCNSPSYTCPSGGTTTDCSKVTCNPIWGDIDNTTHIQTGKAQTPDTSNGCKCKDKTSGIGSTIYRCIAGYYDTSKGIALAGTKPTCEICPPIGNNNVAGKSNPGLTDKPTNQGITSCYIPFNTEITDDTGTYIFYNSGLNINPGCKWTE